MPLVGYAQNLRTCLFSSMTLPVNAEDNTKQSDNNTRLYVEAYGFFPLETHSKTTLNNNITSEMLDLNDVLDMLTGVFSGKVAVEKGRFGLQAGLDHLSFRTSEMVSSWQSSNPIQNESHPRLPQRRINSEGTKIYRYFATRRISHTHPWRTKSRRRRARRALVREIFGSTREGRCNRATSLPRIHPTWFRHR